MKILLIANSCIYIYYYGEFMAVPQPGDIGGMMVELGEFERRIHSENDLAAVLRTIRGETEALGIIRQGYFFIPVYDRPTSDRTRIFTHGFPEGWSRSYLYDGLRQIDPLPGATLAAGRLVFWSEVKELTKSDPSVRPFFAAMETHSLEHGFGVPLFGPSNRSGYGFFDFGRPAVKDDQPKLFAIRTMAQIAHQRICMILETRRTVPKLSPRELQVLGWIAVGKSSSVIAQILEISPETVKTYKRRLYEKLDAYDRTSATLRAFKLGLIEPANRAIG